MLAKCIRLWQLCLLPPNVRSRKLQNVSCGSEERSYSQYSPRSCLKGSCAGAFLEFFDGSLKQTDRSSLPSHCCHQSSHTLPVLYIELPVGLGLRCEGKLWKTELDQKITEYLQWETKHCFKDPLSYLILWGFWTFTYLSSFVGCDANDICTQRCKFCPVEGQLNRPCPRRKIHFCIPDSTIQMWYFQLFELVVTSYWFSHNLMS